MAPQTTRHLFRLAAIIDERNLHQILLRLSELKALDVSVHPVVAPTEQGGTLPEIIPPKAGSAGEAIHAAFGHENEKVTVDKVADANPHIQRSAIHQQLYLMTRQKKLRRVKKGVYAMTAKGKANGSAAHVNGAHTGSMDFLKELLGLAPGHTLAIPEIKAGFAAHGRNTNSKAISSTITRALKAKLIRRRGRATYQLKGV